MSSDTIRQQPRPGRGSYSKDIERIIMWGLFSLLVIYLLSGTYVIQPNERGVIRRFGRHICDNVPPGIHYCLPYPIHIVDTPKVTEVKRIRVGYTREDEELNLRPQPEATMFLTGDENVVSVKMVVQYTIKDASAYLFRTSGPEQAIRTFIESFLTEVIGSMDVDEVLTVGKFIIQEKIKAKVQGALDNYGTGTQIMAVQLKDIAPSWQLAAAFRDVASAKGDKNRLINEANGYKDDLLPKAQGQAHEILLEAQAYKDKRINGAKGAAERFNQVFEQYRKAKDVTSSRLYIEAMGEILPKMRKYIIDERAKEDRIDLRIIKQRGADIHKKKD